MRMSGIPRIIEAKVVTTDTKNYLQVAKQSNGDRTVKAFQSALL